MTMEIDVIKAQNKMDINNLQNMFLCCYNVSFINWQSFFKSISWDDQKSILNHTILHNLNCELPIKKSYQLSFLKNLMKTLESQNAEIHDEIYENFCKLQNDNLDENDTFTYKHYCLPILNTTISLKESKNFVSDGTTGLCSWQASLALSEWLIENSYEINDKLILELGAGTGLCSLIASKCCNAKEVLVSDGSIKVINLLNYNLHKNIQIQNTISDNIRNLKICEIKGNRKIGTFLLPWEDIEVSKVENIIRPEVILAADVIYDNSVFEALSKTVKFLFNLMGNKCKLVLAATVRNEETLKSFLNILDEFVIIKQKSFISKHLHWDQTIPIEIYVIEKKG